jgi:tetratricopeptide (TPR) repeat protein
VVRIVAILVGLPVLLAGAFGLLAAYSPGAELTFQIQAGLQDVVKGFVESGLPRDFAVTLEEWLTAPALRFSLAPVGLVLLLLGCFPKRQRKAEEEAEASAPDDGVAPIDKRLLKKTQKQAVALAKKGQVLDAAEMLFSAGLMDKAAEYFIQANEPIRAAEIRHDQNRFIESAELYLAAEKYESAGTIFGQQQEYLRAAECFLKADTKSVAAEMFEKGGEFRRAGDCYREVEFARHAAQVYVKCHAWREAAECLEEVFREESTKAGAMDPKKQTELRKLVRQASKLYERAKDLEKAREILERGDCPADAARIALALEEYSRAAELFLSAGEAEHAAQALRSLGENEEAARIMGEYHRDRGELVEAAGQLEEATDFLAAGDLYRQLEDYPRAGECYSREGEHAQAAEMFRLAGDRRKAAECYERANRFTEAAECYALAGRNDREAELLEKAGNYLGAGEAYHREGVDDEAIRVLQKVDPESEGFAVASALLGDIFQVRGQFSLAIKKLKQSLGDRDLARESLPIFYALATVHEANQDVREAAEIYEKILAFDYHYKDVEQRLLRVRELVKSLGPAESTAQDTATSRGFTQGGQPGRYQIVGELGRGGMGIVYKANDTVLDRLVAYKVLPDALKENPQALKNFLREAKAAAPWSSWTAPR